MSGVWFHLVLESSDRKKKLKKNKIRPKSFQQSKKTVPEMGGERKKNKFFSSPLPLLTDNQHEKKTEAKKKIETETYANRTQFAVVSHKKKSVNRPEGSRV